MRYLLKPLKKLVNVITRNHRVNHFKEIYYKYRLNKQVNRLQSELEELLMKNSESMKFDSFSIHMYQLTLLCDELYLKERGMALKSGYAAIILNLIITLKKTFSKLVDNEMPTPILFRDNQCRTINEEWDSIVFHWNQNSISKRIIKVAHLPLEDFFDSREISWFNFIWIRKYLQGYKAIDFDCFAPYPSKDYMVFEYLVKMNYNHPRFTRYCKHLIKYNVDLFPDTLKQIVVLTFIKKNISQLVILSLKPFCKNVRNAKYELIRWIEIEIPYRKDFNDKFLWDTNRPVSTNPNKYIYNITGEQLAFWKKLQHDHGLFEKENLDIFCQKIAYNSSTTHQMILSPGSIKSKLYSKNEAVIRPLHDILKNMLEEIRPFLGSYIFFILSNT